MKKCTKCKISKLLSDFPVGKKRSDGRMSWCKVCMNDWIREYRSNPIVKKQVALRMKEYNEQPDRKERRLRYGREYFKTIGKFKKYGITQDDMDKMFIKQNGKCPCGLELSDNTVIDHDHETGKVRGLLHSTCNTILGLIKEEPIQLRNLANYIETICKLREENKK